MLDDSLLLSLYSKPGGGGRKHKRQERTTIICTLNADISSAAGCEVFDPPVRRVIPWALKDAGVRANVSMKMFAFRPSRRHGKMLYPTPRHRLGMAYSSNMVGIIYNAKKI